MNDEQEKHLRHEGEVALLHRRMAEFQRQLEQLQGEKVRIEGVRTRSVATAWLFAAAATCAAVVLVGTPAYSAPSAPVSCDDSDPNLYCFSPGEPARASQVSSNFQSLENRKLNRNESGVLGFGADTRQMINLWSTTYGIGVQGSTLYFRTGKNFAWYTEGAHNDGELNAGGGDRLMYLNSGGLRAEKRVHANAGLTVQQGLSANSATVSGQVNAGSLSVGNGLPITLHGPASQYSVNTDGVSGNGFNQYTLPLHHTARGVCFLTKTYVRETDQGNEAAGCLVERGTNWRLKAWKQGGDAWASCTAMCLSW